MVVSELLDTPIDLVNHIDNCIPKHGTFTYRYSKFSVPKYFCVVLPIVAHFNLALDAQIAQLY